MATAPILEIDPHVTTVPATTPNAGVVLMNREAFNAWYDKLRDRAPANVDISTKKGRDELRSYAATVRSEKAAIDKARLRLTKEWRDMTAQANAAGKEIEEKLESLAAEIRAPLTAWEKAEEDRVSRVTAIMDALRSAAAVGYDETAERVRSRLGAMEATEFDPGEFDGHLRQATLLRDQAIEALTAAVARIEREEAERAELDKLRAEAAARAAKEGAEQEERDRVERERVAAEEAEARRVAAAEAEAARIKQAEERAAEAARAEVARKAREAEEERERQHQAAIAEERRQRQEAERAALEEREQREREDAARKAEEARVAIARARQEEEDRKREANRAHRSRVQRAAKEAIMACGVAEPTAVDIVKAIVAGRIPAVTLSF